jgi:hypothetical protein
MAAHAPADMQEFMERFPSWPKDSLKQIIDIEAGSRWTIRDIGIVQVLRQDLSRDFPHGFKISSWKLARGSGRVLRFRELSSF